MVNVFVGTARVKPESTTSSAAALSTPTADAPSQTSPGLKMPPARTSLTRRERIWIFMEDDPLLNVAILLVIVLSTACFVLETEFRDDSLSTMWFSLETFAVAVFTIEYAVRASTCPQLRAFVLAPLNIVDLIAIVPYYIGLFMAFANGEAPWETTSPIAGTTVLRAVRLMRVFRIFKLGRYSSGMQIFYGALAHSATSLFLLFFLLLITVILFSSMMYLVEGEGSRDQEWCESSPENLNTPVCYFKSIPTTFWWAIVTITTVGYGDAIPNTVAGKAIASVTMIAGIIVIALPISVLGNNFTKLMQQYTDESVIITQADQDGSGFVDSTEVARWLQAMRRAGKIRDERVTAEDLVARYDKGGKVGLERKEFLKMCRETVHVGGPSNRELLQKMMRLGEQLGNIQERLSVLEQHVAGERQSGSAQANPDDSAYDVTAAQVPLPLPPVHGAMSRSSSSSSIMPQGTLSAEAQGTTSASSTNRRRRPSSEAEAEQVAVDAAQNASQPSSGTEAARAMMPAAADDATTSSTPPPT